MRAIIDTNVIIDVVLRRGEFYDDSYRIVQVASQKLFDGFVIASAVSDIYYVTRKSTLDTKKAWQEVADLVELVGICDTRAADISAALSTDMPDFEDAIVAAVAKREKADYIVTRNICDYQNSPVPALTPVEFLKKLDTDFFQEKA